MKYIVAVSGGVDSVVLLHMLHNASPHDLVVAHVDHGIRPDSRADAEFVAQLAQSYGLPFESLRLELGPYASEDVARRARYAWLESLRSNHNAHSIATAHHADDVLETAVLNIGRGTGWRGIASLRSVNGRYRPLLSISKAQLVRYALEHGLEWRDDNTNDTLRYTRNCLRHGVLPRFSSEQRRQLLSLVRRQQELRAEIESAVEQWLIAQQDKCEGMRRYDLIMLPDMVALEILRCSTHGRCDPRQLRKILHFARTGRDGAVLEAGNGCKARIRRRRLIVSCDKIEQLIR